MKKSQSNALIAAKSVFLAMGLYAAIQLLLALLAVKSVLPVGRLFPCQLVSCAAAVFAGGLFAARRISMGSLPAAMIVTGAFLFLQIVIGLSLSDEIAWTGEGGALLLAGLAGGILAGLFGSRTVHRKKKRAGRGK